MVVAVFFLLEPPLPLVLGLISASAVVAFFLLEPPLPLVLGSVFLLVSLPFLGCVSVVVSPTAPASAWVVAVVRSPSALRSAVLAPVTPLPSGVLSAAV